VADAAAQLPIGEVLPSILEALEQAPSLVLEAPPGAGKTTLVPLALLAHAGWLDGGRVVVLEPRRLAAKAAARRMAAALGERVGGTVGYSVRGDSATSNRTRVEVVTTGVLLRRLQRDPSLAGIACVLLDEFHERGCDADLALALAAQSQALLRPELRIAVMSATLGGTLAAQCQAVLRDARLIQSAGRAFPVQVRHLAEPGRGRGELEEATAQAVQLALREVAEGDCLVFLPGAPEIRRVLRLLDGAVGSASVMPLFGDLAQEAQDAALAPPPPGVRRVILSSAIAESSLTIPGVRIVVDSGLSRRAAFSPANGLSRLVTVRTSGASEAQRAGRAGRTAPGFCYRLYGAAAGAQREEQTPPEILSADLAPLALELAVWGASAESLAWVTPPPAAALQAAALLLRRLGTLTEAGAPSEHGRACAALGVHPRLAHMIARAAEAGPAAARLACSVAALLEERDLLRKGAGAIVGGPGADLRLRLAALEGRLGDGAPELGGWDVDRGVQARVRDSARLLYGQLLDALGEPAPAAAPLDGTHAVGLLLALAYPDRVGASRSGAFPVPPPATLCSSDSQPGRSNIRTRGCVCAGQRQDGAASAAAGGSAVCPFIPSRGGGGRRPHQPARLQRRAAAAGRSAAPLAGVAGGGGGACVLEPQLRQRGRAPRAHAGLHPPLRGGAARAAGRGGCGWRHRRYPRAPGLCGVKGEPRLARLAQPRQVPGSLGRAERRRPARPVGRGAPRQPGELAGPLSGRGEHQGAAGAGGRGRRAALPAVARPAAASGGADAHSLCRPLWLANRHRLRERRQQRRRAGG